MKNFSESEENIMSKVSDYVSKEFDAIIKDSGGYREYRAYELGVALGWYYLYTYMSEKNSVEEVKKTFNAFLKEIDNAGKQCEYFKNLVELSEEPKDNIDKLNKN